MTNDTWVEDVAHAVADTARAIGEPVVVTFGDCRASVARVSGSLDSPVVEVRRAGQLVGAGMVESVPKARWVNGRVVASPLWRSACPTCGANADTSCFLGGSGTRADNGWVHPSRRVAVQ